MNPGRKRKPDQLKIIQGTDQKVRMNENAIEIPKVSKLPNAPRWLNPRGQKLYKSVGEEMLSLGLINNLNVIGYAIMVDSLARYIEMAEEIKEQGLFGTRTTSNDTYETLHPRVKAQQAAEETFRKWAVEFGLTPSAQSRIIGNLTKPEDPTENDFS